TGTTSGRPSRSSSATARRPSRFTRRTRKPRTRRAGRCRAGGRAWSASRISSRRRCPALLLLVALRLELCLVLLDVDSVLVGHVEQLRPLLLVERHREPPETVDRDAALLGDLERAGSAGRLVALQLLVLGAEPLELCFEIVVG